MRALILGATGLTGKAFLKHTVEDPAVSTVYTLTRREIDGASSKVNSIVDKNTETWSDKVPEVDVIFSSLATTRGAAGGFANQYKIDHDLNVELAKAAKAKGAKTYVLVSSTGANVNSFLPYLKMKGEIERDILALDFEKTVILRPGILLGQRDGNFKGFANAIGERIGAMAYGTFFAGLVSHPVYGDDVSKVGLQAAKSLPNGAHIIDSAEIVQLGSKK